MWHASSAGCARVVLFTEVQTCNYSLENALNNWIKPPENQHVARPQPPCRSTNRHVGTVHQHC